MLTENEIFKISNRNRIFQKNFDRNRNFEILNRNFSEITEIEIFKISKQNRFFFRKCWPKLRFSKSWTQIEIFSKMLFEIHFFATVDRNRDFQNFEPKSKFFQKCRLKSRFSKFWAESNFCSKMLIEVESFEILNRNPFFFQICWPKSRFSKFWTVIEIFSKNVDQNGAFQNFEPKSEFRWKILTEIKIFEIFYPNWIFFRNLVWNRDFQNFELNFICFQNVDRNQNFRYFEPKSKFFRKCWPKMRFFKYWTEIIFFFENIDRNQDFRILNRNRIFFSKNVRNRDPRNYEPKSKSLWNCWQKRDFRNFQPKLKFFRKCWPELRCSQFWLESDFYFRKYWSKPRFSKFWTVFEIFPKLLTEIEIFKISNWNGIFLEKVDRNRLFFRKCRNFEIYNWNQFFFENIDRNRDFRNFEPKWKFFRKCWLKWRFSKFWTQTELFSKMLTEIWTEIEVEIFKILNRNRIFFNNVDRNRDFLNFEPNRIFVRKCWSKSRFLKFWTEILFFFKYVDRNRDFRNFEPKSKYFQKMLTEMEPSKILNRNRNLFGKYWPKSRFSKFFTQIEFFSEM